VLRSLHGKLWQRRVRVSELALSDFELPWEKYRWVLNGVLNGVQLGEFPFISFHLPRRRLKIHSQLA